MRELELESFYSRLRDSVKVSSLSPLLIFPSTSDVDSLCALKIIFHVLESDSVRYSCYPVSSFQEIHKYTGADLSSSDEPISVLLINWGCHRDLQTDLKLGPAVTVFVIDSHRPIHLHNLSEQNKQVVVLYTEDDENFDGLNFDFNVMELADASYSLHDAGLQSEGEDDSESEDEDEDEDEDEEDGDEDSNSRKRRRTSTEGEKEAASRRFKRLKREYYQMGTFHGHPSGCLVYHLSNSLRKNTNELLWLACVSLTDQFVHERLTDERYKAVLMGLQLHIDSSNSSVVTSVTLQDGTTVRAPESSRITYGEEPRLMLLREWSLFDSMLCSQYIATKLKTWSDNGIKKLKLLLARMGIALVDCQQKYRYMNHEVKQKMKGEFERFLPQYGLDGLYYTGVIRHHGYSSIVSAADVVYGVTALLESFVESDGSCASKQFGVAFDALSLGNLDKLKDGMQHAIKIQRAILRQGSAAIMKSGCIRSGRKFRWVKLEDTIDAKLLGYPQALTKFCYFLMDALKEKGARMKPMLCACTSQQLGKLLIVGVFRKPRLGAVQGNAFGAAFRVAAEETGAGFYHELFESSWIVLDKNAVNSFMISLTEKL